MIAEPSFGAGSIMPPEEYLPQIRLLTRELGIVWIVDEVLTGFGRMGEWFGHQLYDVEPDIMTMAKDSAVSMAAVCANIEHMIENDLVDQSKKAGEYFGRKLRELEEKHKCIGQVAGSGMLWNVEIVKDKETGERFAPEDRYTTYSGDLSNYPEESMDKAIDALDYALTELDKYAK